MFYDPSALKYPGEQPIYDVLLSTQRCMTTAELQDYLEPVHYFGVSSLCRALYARGFLVATYSVDGKAITVDNAILPAYEFVGENVHQILGQLAWIKQIGSTSRNLGVRYCLTLAFPFVCQMAYSWAKCMLTQQSFSLADERLERC